MRTRLGSIKLKSKPQSKKADEALALVAGNFVAKNSEMKVRFRRTSLRTILLPACRWRTLESKIGTSDRELKKLVEHFGEDFGETYIQNEKGSVERLFYIKHAEIKQWNTDEILVRLSNWGFIACVIVGLIYLASLLVGCGSRVTDPYRVSVKGVGYDIVEHDTRDGQARCYVASTLSGSTFAISCLPHTPNKDECSAHVPK